MVGYSRFEDYCRERWGWTDRRARQLMSAAETVKALETGTIVPTNEAQARELARHNRPGYYVVIR